MRRKNGQEIKKEFEVRKVRQIIAIALTLFFILLCAILNERPILYANFSKGVLVGAQIVAIAAFVGFSALNWRCPSCGKYIGGDIGRKTCKKCKARLR